MYFFSIKKYTRFLEGRCSCCMCGQPVSSLVLPSSIFIDGFILSFFFVCFSTNDSFDSCEGTNSHKFFRTLRLKEFFCGQDRPLTHSSCSASGDTRETTGREDVTSTALSAGPKMPFKGRSTFIPPPNRNASTNTNCRLVKNDVSLLLHKKREYKVAHNLTKEQRHELKTLQKDKTVIILSVDEGGAMVILNCSAYDREIQRQLNNTIFYKKNLIKIQH